MFPLINRRIKYLVTMMTIFLKKRLKLLKNSMKALQAIRARATIKILSSKCHHLTMSLSRALESSIRQQHSPKVAWALAASNNKDNLLQMCSLNKLEPQRAMEWAEVR